MSATFDTIKANQTEPIEFVLDASNIDNLDELSNAYLYVRKDGADSNHVDGVSLTVEDSANKIVSFDPVGAAADGGDAFDETGVYKMYAHAEWSDGDDTRHPDEGYTVLNIEEVWD